MHVIGAYLDHENAGAVLVDGTEILEREQMDADELKPFLRNAKVNPTIVCLRSSANWKTGSTSWKHWAMAGQLSESAPCWFAREEVVKYSLCGTPRARHATVFQCLVDMYGPNYHRAVGMPGLGFPAGPLYGMLKEHHFALATAIVFQQDERVRLDVREFTGRIFGEASVPLPEVFVRPQAEPVPVSPG